MSDRPAPDSSETGAPSHRPGPRVSVIIPFHNAAATLAEAMDSVLAQTVPDWEAVLIDDGSTDDGAAMIQSMARRDPRVRLLRLPANIGTARARNAGIAAARGRFIAFLDADDRWLPMKLERQLPVLEGGAPLVCAAYRRIDAQGRPLGVVRPPARFAHRDALGGNPVGCLTAVWDRARFPDARMPELPMHEDYAFWLSLLRQGIEGRGLPEVLAEYRVAPGSRSARKWRAARATWAVLRAEPGVGLARAVRGFLLYAWRSVGRSIRQRA